MLCAVLCFFVIKYEEIHKHGQQNRLKTWSKNREQIHKKHEKQWENSQNMNSVFGTIWPSTDPKMVQN